MLSLYYSVLKTWRNQLNLNIAKNNYWQKCIKFTFHEISTLKKIQFIVHKNMKEEFTQISHQLIIMIWTLKEYTIFYFKKCCVKYFSILVNFCFIFKHTAFLKVCSNYKKIFLTTKFLKIKVISWSLSKTKHLNANL